MQRALCTAIDSWKSFGVAPTVGVDPHDYAKRNWVDEMQMVGAAVSSRSGFVTGSNLSWSVQTPTVIPSPTLQPLPCGHHTYLVICILHNAPRHQLAECNGRWCAGDGRMSPRPALSWKYPSCWKVRVQWIPSSEQEILT